MVEVTISLILESQQKEAQVLCKMTSHLNAVKRSFAYQQRPWGRGKFSVSPPPCVQPGSPCRGVGTSQDPAAGVGAGGGGGRVQPPAPCMDIPPFPSVPRDVFPCPSLAVCAEPLRDELIHHPNPKETFCLSASRIASPVDTR